MNICFPTTKDNGLESRVSAHFGSAPYFIIVDSESGECRTIPNANHSHEHGRCQPMVALSGQDIDDVVVKGIGAGALSRLTAGGVRVLMAPPGAFSNALAAYKSGTLAEISPDSVCQDHGPHARHRHQHHRPRG